VPAKGLEELDRLPVMTHIKLNFRELLELGPDFLEPHIPPFFVWKIL
jgi:hypothetical protein